MEKELIIEYTKPEFGRTRKGIKCPFCRKQYEVFWWSFSGCGKKCSCGAKLSRLYARLEINKKGGFK